MKQFKLVDSNFTVEEAKQVLLGLIGYKIQFHSQKVFSNDERFGLDDQFSKNRIKELEKIRKQLLKYFNNLSSNKLNMKVDSIVKLNLLENEFEDSK